MEETEYKNMHLKKQKYIRIFLEARICKIISFQKPTEWIKIQYFSFRREFNLHSNLKLKTTNKKKKHFIQQKD